MEVPSTDGKVDPTEGATGADNGVPAPDQDAHTVQEGSDEEPTEPTSEAAAGAPQQEVPNIKVYTVTPAWIWYTIGFLFVY